MDRGSNFNMKRFRNASIMQINITERPLGSHSQKTTLHGTVYLSGNASLFGGNGLNNGKTAQGENVYQN